MAEDTYTTFQIVVLHARAHRNFRSHLNNRLKAHGMTAMEWALLGLISQQPKNGVSVTELASMLSVKTALASVMVSKQAKAGMVDKVASKKDSRLRQICLTEDGKVQIKKIEEELHSSLESWFKDIGVDDVDSYIKTLAALSEAKP